MAEQQDRPTQHDALGPSDTSDAGNGADPGHPEDGHQGGGKEHHHHTADDLKQHAAEIGQQAQDAAAQIGAQTAALGTRALAALGTPAKFVVICYGLGLLTVVWGLPLFVAGVIAYLKRHDEEAPEWAGGHMVLIFRTAVVGFVVGFGVWLLAALLGWIPILGWLIRSAALLASIATLFWIYARIVTGMIKALNEQALADPRTITLPQAAPPGVAPAAATSAAPAQQPGPDLPA